MAKDDYFVLVNRLLRYLYKCLKQGASPNWELIAPNTKDFPVGEEYFVYILSHLLADGYIEGIVEVANVRSVGRFKETTGLKITPAGIEYLEENSTMKKVTELLGPAGEIADTVLSNFWR